MIYLIGSLRNPCIPEVAARLRQDGYDVFEEWWSAGPGADDHWQAHAQSRGMTYKEALASPHAQNVFEFDKKWLTAADAVVLVSPAGRSGHLELGWALGQGKPGFVLLAPDTAANLPTEWRWLAGLYEGEGSITKNGTGGTGVKLQLNSTDKEIVERAQLVAGAGYVYGPYKQVGSNLKKAGVFKDQWRWAVHKKADAVRVIGGMWPDLGERRREQIQAAFKAAGIDAPDPTVYAAVPPRHDVMYNFASAVCVTVVDLIWALRAANVGT